MSNLSELLPAGAGAKSAEFVASGTLSSGQTVGLKADGTVEAVAETTVSPSMPLGTQTEFAPRHSVLNNIAADPHNSNRWVIAWADDDGSEDVLVRIITLSGTTWTLSSEINMGLSGSVSRTPSVAWDKATANKIVITYNNSSNDGSAKVGTISGSAGSESIAFGAEHTFTTQTMYSYSRNPPQLLCLDNSGNYFQAFVGSTGYNTSVYGIILQAPSTTVTSGSEATLTTTAKDGASSASIVPTDSTKVIFSYLETTQEKPALKQLSISGTSITVGSENLGPTLTADEGFSITAIDATKIVMITTTNGTKYPAYQISTNSSGSFSFGTLTVITSDRSLYVNASNNLSGDPSTFITSYTNSSGTRYARAKVGTINADISSISFNTETQLSTTVFSNYANIAQQSDSSGTFAYLFERTGGDKSFIVLGKTGGLSTNSTDFIGITAEAISDTATGAVIVQGGVSDKLSGLTAGADYYVQADGSLASGNIPYDISGATYLSQFDPTAQISNPTGLAFNADGTKMFIVDYSSQDVNEYSLSTAWDVTSASYVRNYSVSAQEVSPNAIAFNTNGTKMFILGQNGDDVNEYTLSTGFDLGSTITFVDSFSVAAKEGQPTGLAFNTNGTKMYVVGEDSDAVHEYELSIGFDVSTASFTQSYSVASEDIQPRAVAFSSNGTKMFITGDINDAVHEYSLSVGFDVSSSSYTGNSLDISAQEVTPYAIQFDTDGSKMFISGITSDKIGQYSTSSPASTTVPAGKALSATSILLEG